ncbi:hypothetical protein [Arthrobacter sp. A2-55]|uniref:hypothetical protein n=1 Tax=Arthrobacter sp. A2-55 TaxID=2897337 RepID=UPI0021CDC133|nr:hypothetical protein [Arthrobacter sp. A2-55]MCU6480161.1 hypothetical protein [Arthrobacter sp. A2-55]
MTAPGTGFMPDAEASLLRRAYRDFVRATNPRDRWANRKLASVVRAAVSAGWSRRTTAAALGIPRERALRICEFEPASTYPMPRYAPGTTFPATAVTAFRELEWSVTLRRTRAEAHLAAVIHAAHHAGWPYPALGQILDLSGERVRQIAETPASSSPEKFAFTPYVRPLKGPRPRAARGSLTAVELEELGRLAGIARTATKVRPGADVPEDKRAARKASEALSALIAAARDRKVPWAQIDAACGYNAGGARARAIRHGYGKIPPSMRAYQPTVQ